MDLTFKKRKQMSSKEIFNVLLFDIENIYNLFSYMNISKNDYDNLVLNEIINTKNITPSDRSYNEYLKRRIILKLYSMLKSELSDNNKAFYILDSYINKKVKLDDSYENNIKEIKNFSLFLDKCDYTINIDVLINLINKNEIFKGIIESIYLRNREIIISGNIDSITTDNNIITILETYCLLNNIEIKDNNKSLTYDDNDATDSIRAYMNEIRDYPILTQEQEKSLSLRLSKGDENAREIFIQSNLKLVVKIAERYTGKGLLFLDLIQEGNLGLLTAVDKFDATKGYKFSTYATWWIRQSIVRALTNQSRTIRIPSYVYQKVILYKKTSDDLEAKLNRKPTIKEIADRMQIPLDEAEKLCKLQLDTVSINTPMYDAEDLEIKDTIPMPDDDTEGRIINKDMKQKIEEIFTASSLTPQEVMVLKLKYGFDGNEPISLSQIGKRYNFTRERARQIELSALVKIRRSGYIYALAESRENPDKALEDIKIFRKMYEEEGFSKKSFLKGSGGISKNKASEIQTIYEFFKHYTKEEVDEMLTKLDDEDRKLIVLKYGEDLDNPIPSRLDLKGNCRYNGYLLHKMRTLLPKRDTVSNHPAERFVISKEEYDRIKEIFKTISYEDILKVLTPEEILIAFKLGYISSEYLPKYIVVEDIDINNAKKLEVMKKVLSIYKNNINTIVNSATKEVYTLSRIKNK